MMQWLLLRLFNLVTMDVSKVAQTLAAGILDDYTGLLDELDPMMTRQYLRTQYMRQVNRYGLPPSICNEVADQAWALIAQLREVKTDAVTSAEFSFYD